MNGRECRHCAREFNFCAPLKRKSSGKVELKVIMNLFTELIQVVPKFGIALSVSVSVKCEIFSRPRCSRCSMENKFENRNFISTMPSMSVWMNLFHWICVRSKPTSRLRSIAEQPLSESARIKRNECCDSNVLHPHRGKLNQRTAMPNQKIIKITTIN